MRSRATIRRTARDTGNPLKGKHGFVEFCPLPLHGYFWGVSYVYPGRATATLINKRIDGINMMLRKQEDPPRFMSGSTTVNQNAYAKLNRPGGYFTDGNPGAKIQDLAKEVPTDIWRSFHELNCNVRHRCRHPSDHPRRGRGQRAFARATPRRCCEPAPPATRTPR